PKEISLVISARFSSENVSGISPARPPRGNGPVEGHRRVYASRPRNVSRHAEERRMVRIHGKDRDRA
ncbi:MAG: hypothetical protein ACKOHG_20750, partial [Planctomycetia bacterium]